MGSRGVEHAALQIGAQAAQALARDQLHLDGDEGPGAGFLQRRRLAGAQTVGAPLARVQDAADLVVVVQPVAVREIGVEGIGGGLQHGRLDVARFRSAHSSFRPGRPACRRPGNAGSRAASAAPGGGCQQRLLEELRKLHVADALVVLGARDGELLGRDAPVEQMPGPGRACSATRWHSQWVSKPVTSGSGPMRRPL